MTLSRARESPPKKIQFMVDIIVNQLKVQVKLMSMDALVGWNRLRVTIE